MLKFNSQNTSKWCQALRMTACATIFTAIALPASAQWTITDLGRLPGGWTDYSIAFGINNAGQAVGSSVATTGNRAFLWQNGSMTNLGSLLGQDDYSYASGINNAGQVVGSSIATAGARAFLWQNGSMVDLNTVAGVAGTGWSLLAATDINDSGQIVGHGYSPSGAYRGFILAPVPEPEHWAMLLAGLGLVGWSTRRRKQRDDLNNLSLTQ